MPTTIDKESAFADLIRDYENQWIAIIEKDGVELVVGTGSSPSEAAKEAASKGFPSAMLFKVPSFTSRFIPSSTAPVSASISN